MKLFAVIICFQVSLNSLFAQNPMIRLYADSLASEKTDSGRARFLYLQSYYYQNYKPDSALLLARSAYSISKRSGFLKGEATSLGLMGLAFNRLGNFAKALEYYLEQLKIQEKRGDQEEIARAYLSISIAYNSQKDRNNALRNAYKADSIARKEKLWEMLLYTSLDIGDIYSTYNELDSARFYTLSCLDEASKHKPDLNSYTVNLLSGTALNNLGNINFKAGSYEDALVNYRNSIPLLDSAHDENTMAECRLGLAKTFEKLGKKDSAMKYASLSYQQATANQFLKHAMNASAFLQELYKNERRIDSAFAYQATYISLRDSFDNSERVKQLQSLTISEQIRQQQAAEEKMIAKKERKKKLQLFLIGIFIPVLFFLTLYISNKRVSSKLIRILGILSLLFFFEYLSLLIHPLVAKKSGHQPLVEIFIFVLIAAIILPLHHRIEHWLMEKLKARQDRSLKKLQLATEEQVPE